MHSTLGTGISATPKPRIAVLIGLPANRALALGIPRWDGYGKWRYFSSSYSSVFGSINDDRADRVRHATVDSADYPDELT